MSALKYPNARKDASVVDDYHGTKMPDFYTWMEDPDCDETKAFVEAQNEISVPYLKECPHREKFFDRLTELYNYPKYSCPFKRGSHYYYFMNSGLQNQSVMYKQANLSSEPRVFLDPNKLSDDGTVSLSGRRFSEDGRYFAYGLSNSGSDWITIKFKDAENEKDLPDVLERVKFSSMAWTHDNKGMFYNAYVDQEGKTDGTEVTSNINQKLFYHRLGTKQSDDVLFAEFKDNPRWMSGAQLSDDGNYVLLSISEGCDPVNRLWYVDLRTLDGGISSIPAWVKLVDNFDAEYEYITNEGSLFTFKTNLNAPRYKLINIDITKPDMNEWKTLIAEHDSDVLEWATCVNQDKLVVEYLRDVKSALELRQLKDGSLLKKFPLDVGSVVGFSGRKEQNEIFYQFTSFLSPGIIFHYDFEKSEPHSEVFREIKVKGFDASLFETKQVFYSSKDDTKIPMFIVHKKGIPLSGNHPTLLYGYGGFNISITPSFSVSRVIFMQHMGGVLAIANIRGGGEYGETWHRGGMLAKKQNCFDDFQHAAEHLINEGYTSPNKLTINGGSNGGLLVAACINQRPDLFGCAVAQVGVMDMLKFHKYTIGHAWTTDFGSSDNEEQFQWLIKYSPIHNVGNSQGPQKNQYPSLLLLTGDHDDRVVPHHSLKYIATVQDKMGASPNQRNPLLIRVDTKSGHGGGKPTSKIIEETSDIYGFIGRNVDADWLDCSVPVSSATNRL
ncbi:prolyl endopeptidase-like isoform X1 [Clavelina lepadiformis]|uniref:prolyl endopeptidase-like isoform X1 n=1 Tax=Clavelina lepadiformis TaxID=159417 RepID=UPI0040423CD5